MKLSFLDDNNSQTSQASSTRSRGRPNKGSLRRQQVNAQKQRNNLSIILSFIQLLGPSAASSTTSIDNPDQTDNEALSIESSEVDLESNLYIHFIYIFNKGEYSSGRTTSFSERSNETDDSVQSGFVTPSNQRASRSSTRQSRTASSTRSTHSDRARQQSRDARGRFSSRIPAQGNNFTFLTNLIFYI